MEPVSNYVMNSKIKKITVNNLFGYKNISWELNPDVNVLVGKNGLGKSTLLRILLAATTHKPFEELELCDSIIVDYDDETSTKATSKDTRDSNSIKLALEEFINSNDFETQLEDAIRKSKNKASIKASISNKIKSEIIKSIENESNIKSILKTYQFQSAGKDKKSKTIDVEFISTINMSANSINKIQTSDGKVSTVLDFEIKNEIQRLIDFNDNQLIDKLINVLDIFFAETNKKTLFDKDLYFIEGESENKLNYKYLSSGERQIIYIFLKVINASKSNSLILMDEPEISLHLSWQEMLLNHIRDVNNNSQIIIVTHSPAIVMNGWMNSFVDIKKIICE